VKNDLAWEWLLPVQARWVFEVRTGPDYRRRRERTTVRVPASKPNPAIARFGSISGATFGTARFGIGGGPAHDPTVAWAFALAISPSTKASMEYLRRLFIFYPLGSWEQATSDVNSDIAGDSDPLHLEPQLSRV
jgi:hypothetical protein